MTINRQNVNVLRTQNTFLECIPSNSNLLIRWVFYRTDGFIVPIVGLFGRDIDKRNIQLLPNIETEPPFHRINITNADVSLHSGVYECSIVTPPGDSTFISRNITVNVLPGQFVQSTRYLTS